MSFVDQEDVLALTEELYTGMIETVAPHKKLRKPFPRLSYDDAIARYGSDKPDLRFGLEMTDVTELAAETGFRVFRSTIESGGCIKGFRGAGHRGIHHFASAATGGFRAGIGRGGAGAYPLPGHRAASGRPPCYIL